MKSDVAGWCREITSCRAFSALELYFRVDHIPVCLGHGLVRCTAVVIELTRKPGNPKQVSIMTINAKQTRSLSAKPAMAN